MLDLNVEFKLDRIHCHDEGDGLYSVWPLLTFLLRAAGRVPLRTLFVLAALVLPAFAGPAHAKCMDGSTSTCSVNGQRGTRECINGHWGPCEELLPPELPGPPPLVPAYPTARAHRSLTLTWNGVPLGGEQYQLQYQVGGAWVGLTPLVSSPATFTHSGLQPDTRYCYRVQGTGSYGLRLSTPRCRFTTDNTTRKAWRAQIELHTANIGDADTDDSVNVVLTDISSGTGVNLTWLDYGRDDFERGTTYTYDLNLNEIALFSDVTKIKITKTGTDGWCLADYRLLVNDREVFAEDFHATPPGCLWIDGNDGHQPTHEVDHLRLRAHPSWQSYMEPPRIRPDLSAYPLITATLTVPRAEAESRVEGMIGHLIHGTKAHWGDQHGRASVEADPSAYLNRVAMDLDLEASVDYWFDPELDIDFDLHYQAKCSDDQTKVVVEVKTEALNVSVDLDWFVELWSLILPCGPIVSVIEDEGIPDCITALEDYIAERIEAGFRPITQSSSEALPTGYRCLSGEVVVHENANVDLVFQIEAPAPPPPPPPPPCPGLHVPWPRTLSPWPFVVSDAAASAPNARGRSLRTPDRTP